MKKAISLFLALMLGISLATPIVVFAESEIGVLVNDSPVAWTDAEPYIDENSRTMVPLRPVANALGLSVDWNATTREASFTNGTKTIIFPIGSSAARTSDGGTVTMDTAAVINAANDRTYAPIRYLAEYFGYSVDWNGADRNVIIKGSAQISGETAKGTVKVGHLVDLTGIEAATGNQAKAALDFAVEHALSMGGYEIEVIERDCQSNSVMAATAAAELVAQGVVAIFGPTQIGHKFAVANALSDSGVPLILYNATSSNRLSSSRWAVAAGGTTAQLSTVMADYAYRDLGYRRVYTIRQDSTEGDNYVDPFEERFKALGGEILNSVRLTVSGSDYASLLATFTDESADAIVGWTSNNDAVNFWTSWYELGLNKRLPVMATNNAGFTDFYIMMQLNARNPSISEAILANKTMTAIDYCYSIDNAVNARFVDSWKNEKDSLPNGVSWPGACWQALMVLEAALNATGGDTAPETLLNAIHAVDLTGTEGHISFAGSSAATKDIHIAQLVRLEDGSYNYQLIKTYENVGAGGYAG